MKKSFLFLFVSLFILPFIGHAEEYTFSVLPRYYAEKLTAMTTPFVNYLGSELNTDVQLKLTENFAEYKSEVLNGSVDIGLENPLVYVGLRKEHDVVATAVHGEGGNRFRGIVITGKSSPLAKLEDLKGKKVMIVGKASAGGYLSQKASLRDIGIDVDNDCEIVEATGNHQENVIIAVSIGDVDAGFIHEGAYTIADSYIRPKSIKKMVATSWLPNWALSVAHHVSQDQKKRIREAVLSLPADSPILKALEIDGFVSAEDSDYDSIGSLLQ